jgi:hypothetical protein
MAKRRAPSSPSTPKPGSTPPPDDQQFRNQQDTELDTRDMAQKRQEALREVRKLTESSKEDSKSQ